MSECTGCASCCYGWSIDVLPSEEKQIRKAARRLGVASPVHEGKMRLDEDGGCVLLDRETNRCRIYESQPATCRQWPVSATRVEAGFRLGIDPACSNAVHRTQPTSLKGFLHGQARLLPPAQQELEAQVLAFIATKPSIRELLDKAGTPAFTSMTQLWYAEQDWRTSWTNASPMHAAALDVLWRGGEPAWTEETHEAALRCIRDGVQLRRWAPYTNAGQQVRVLAFGALLSAAGGPTLTGWGIRFSAWVRLSRSPFAEKWKHIETIAGLF